MLLFSKKHYINITSLNIQVNGKRFIVKALKYLEIKDREGKRDWERKLEGDRKR